MPKHKPDRCERWPQCRCGDAWRFWQNPPPNLALTEAEYDAACTVLAVVLACVEYRCPDASVRQSAAVQRLNPIFH